MSNSDQEWFIAERSRALALMHFTRRPDLIVTEASPGIGLEYIVRIAREGEERSLRQFGLLLRGTKNPVTLDHLNKLLRPLVQSLQRESPFPYPVCLLHFTMDDDQGYFTWVVEPAISEEAPQLLLHSEAHCRKLDRAALDEIVERVNRWYDAFFERIAVKAS